MILPSKLAAACFVLAMLWLCGLTEAQGKEKSETVPLDQVIAVARAALNDYQSQATLAPEGKDQLPPLASADFDFKTGVDTKGGIGLNLFVFTLGATREKQITNDLDFVYMPEPKKEEARFLRATETKLLYTSLLETLKAAANAVTQAAGTSVGAPGQVPLDFCQLSVTIAFSVTTNVSGGVAIPFQLVTVTGNLGRSNNNVQQVKLTFKVTDKSVKACAAKP